MHPGLACIACHSMGEGPTFVAAGTVYAAPHESDECYGSTGVTVELTGANGQKITTVSNLSGNFYFDARSSSLTMPYTAKIMADGMEKRMLTPQTIGDCAVCHTAAGASSAPGRISLP